MVLDMGLLAGLEEPGVLADEVVLLDLDELPLKLEGLEDEDGWHLAKWEISSLCSQ